MPYVDLSQIDRVPIAMFVGTYDTTCSYDRAIEYIPSFGFDVKLNIVQDADHVFWNSPLSDYYFQELVSEL